MIKYELCDWNVSKTKYGFTQLPEALLEYSFFIDIQERRICLSPALSQSFWNAEASCELFLDEFLSCFTPESADIIIGSLHRLSGGKLSHTDIQVTFSGSDKEIPALFILSRESVSSSILGIVHLSYDMFHEYQHQLNDVVARLEKAQNINQLILEGSTDYIYQLDLQHNVCTFSPKSLDVLPLEAPTFDNAMDRILSFIHPEDRHIFLESFTPFLSGQSLYHTAEYRVYTKTGEIMWISCHGKGMFNDQGQPVLIAGSLMDITESKKAQEQINHMLYIDPLTNMKNRYCYELELNKCLKNPGAAGSVLCIDVRNFKLYNEIFGRAFGNQILKEFSEMLQMYLPVNLGIYRLEGDEFLIHLKEHDRQAILTALIPLQLALSKARLIGGHEIYIDVTVGIAMYPEHGHTAEELQKNADTVLYKMSKYSKETIMFFENESSEDLSKQYRLENELRMDIEKGFRNFRVVYQPLVQLPVQGEDKEKHAFWCSAEALLRYSNPVLPDVTQGELIETLELTDLIIPVGRWVLDKAVEECSHWNYTGAQACVHVNFSAQQMSDAGILDYIKQTLKKYALPPRCLICELTETSLINNFETALELCRELMDIGVGISLDDFGTGYTSFNYLRTLPISQIKVDKTFVSNLESDEYNQIIIRSLYDLSQNMNLELCVEGVEKKEILDILLNMGVTLIQGFYFERPLEATVIREEFKSHCRESLTVS